MTTVVSELQSVTNVSVRPGDTPEEYANRLVRKANDLTEDKWEVLEEDTQLWVNSAIEAIRKRRPIPLPPGIEELFPEADSEEAETPKTERATSAGRKTATKAAAKSEKAPAVAKPAKKKGIGKNTAGRKGKFSTDAVISLLVDKNPYRESSKAHEVFKKYKEGMTVSEAIEAGIGREHIRWSINHRHIKVS